jgi:hypothetical protein
VLAKIERLLLDPGARGAVTGRIPAANVEASAYLEQKLTADVRVSAEPLKQKPRGDEAFCRFAAKPTAQAEPRTRQRCKRHCEN